MIQLFNDDCLEAMKSIPSGSVDMILQDPPYNTTACKWEWDIMTKIDQFWAEWKRIIKPNGAIVMTASQPFTTKLIASNYKDFKYCWVWNKKQSGNPLNAKRHPLKITEDVIVFNGKKYNPIMRKGTMRKKGGINRQPETTGKVSLDFFSYNDNYYPVNLIDIPNCSNKKDRQHPTQKPVALMEYLIRTYTNEGDTVFDGFAGSGTTAIACLNTGCNFIGCELDETYFNVAKARIEKHQLDIPPKSA